MSETDVKIKEKSGSGKIVKLAVICAVVIIAFLVGFVPMMVQKWKVQDELTSTQKQLRRSEIKGLLTTAIVEAKRGEYEQARQNASSFFTRLDVEQKAEEDARFLKAEEVSKLGAIFTERDAIITMLAQRDPASVERLTNIYSAFMEATGTANPQSTIETAPVQSPASQ